MLSREMLSLAAAIAEGKGAQCIDLDGLVNRLQLLATGVACLEAAVGDVHRVIPADVRDRIHRRSVSAEANVQALMRSASDAARISTVELTDSVSRIEQMLRAHLSTATVARRP